MQTNVRDVRKPIIKGHRAHCLATGKVFGVTSSRRVADPYRQCLALKPQRYCRRLPKHAALTTVGLIFFNYETLQKLAYVSYFCLHQAIAPIAMFVITQCVALLASWMRISTL